VVIDLVALLVEKMTRGVIPARFFMFAGVGVTGLVVHMAILSALYKGTALGFDVAMAAAILISMVWNFWVNNLLTFRDKRLSGWGMVRGFFIFALACSLGAVISQLVGSGLERLHVHWFLAGAAGPLAGGVWNYVAASKLAWGRTGDISSPKPSANGAKGPVKAPNTGVSVTEHLPENRPSDSI
jgi:dolichol-phosphate mannosyltransferase